MSRFTLGNRTQGLILILVAAGAAITALSVLPAHAGQPAKTAAESPDTVAKALTKLDDDWSKAAAKKDAALVASFYADDAIAYPPSEPIAIGKAAAQKTWAAYFADPTFAISWKTLHADASKSGELGFTSGTYECSFKGPDGKQVAEKGKYLCVWKKQKDGSWKAAHDMWNTDTK